MGRVEDKVILITGAASGLGAASARLLAAEGARVVLADIQAGPVTELAEELGPEVARAARLDVRDQAHWDAAIAAAEAAFGALTGLVNSAGVGAYQPIELVTEAEFRRVLDINLVGTFLGIQAAVAAMRTGGRGGSIVNISSLAGLVGLPTAASYTASKWAVRGLTKSVAAEVGRDGIRVNSIHPGMIETPILEGAEAMVGQVIPMLPISRLGRPEEVARLVLYLVSDDSSYTTGTEHAIDGGWHVS